MKKFIVALLLLSPFVVADTPPIVNIFKLKAGTSTGVIKADSGVIGSVSPGSSGNILTSNGTTWVSSAPPSSGVSSVTASSPLFSSGGATPNITCQAASGSQAGCLASADFSTFNSKEPAISSGTTGQYWRGDKTFQTLDTLAVPENTNLYYTATRFNTAFSAKSTTDLSEGTNLYYTDTRARAAISATAPILYSTGVVSCQVASGSLAGCLSSADWTTFNNKQPAGSYVLTTRNINTTAPITGGGDLSADRTIAMPAATTSVDGYLTSTDWNTFNNKQATLTHTLPLLNTANTITINNVTGDSGAGGLAGAVPAPTINQGLTNKYLNASGSFTHPGIKKTPAEGVVAVSTWTGRTAAAANQWFGMVWAPELHLFCSVASSGTNRVQWSRDGITWTAASAAAARVWTKVTWSPELRLFAAVAFDGTTADNVMTSPDCRTWTSRTGTEANQWYDIKWSTALAKFLAVSINGTNRCMSSTNGITWSTCSMAAAIQWYSVTWSPELNLYAAVSITASGGNYAATSPDGVTWTMRALTTGNSWYSVTWAPEIGLFVAVGATGTSRAATSPDGITWTLRAIQAQAWRRVAWSPELRQLVAVSSGGNISTSPDGITWTARTSPEANQWYEIVWSPELMKFVVSGITGTSRVLTSKDIGYIIGDKLGNSATPSNTAEQIIRRDQNGSFSAATVNATSILLNSGVAATNATHVNLNGHYKSTQTTAPTATVNANAGTGATCTVSNATDTAGTINLTTTAVAPALGAQCAVNFNLAYNVAPKCVVSPESTNASLFAVANGTYFTTTTTTLIVNYTNADAAGHANNWTYHCMETQ